MWDDELSHLTKAGLGWIVETMTRPPLFVIDNFYMDPLAMRERALAADFRRFGLYPGFNSVEFAHPEEARARICEELGSEIEWELTVDSGQFRLSGADDWREVDIHVDAPTMGPRSPQWSGVVHLTLPEHCHGGTSLWLHNRTGLCAHPTEEQAREVPELAAFADSTEGLLNYFSEEGKDRSKWTEYQRIPMVFNRLACFQSGLFHSLTSLFGDEPANSRLVHLLFFSQPGVDDDGHRDVDG